MGERERSEEYVIDLSCTIMDNLLYISDLKILLNELKKRNSKTELKGIILTIYSSIEKNTVNYLECLPEFISGDFDKLKEDIVHYLEDFINLNLKSIKLRLKVLKSLSEYTKNENKKKYEFVMEMIKNIETILKEIFNEQL